MSQCQSRDRVLPSYNIVQTSINEIMQLQKPINVQQEFALQGNRVFHKNAESSESPKVKVHFPIAVNYDFERYKWIDNHSGNCVGELPWALGYPHLNNVLVFGVLHTNSKGTKYYNINTGY